MDYTHFLRGALDLGTRAVGAYERHVTVAEARLELDRDGPLPGELGPPPPPEAACTCGPAADFAFLMPSAVPADDDIFRVDYAAEGRAKAEAFGPRMHLMPDADVTDLQRAQAEVLIERAKVEALERQVAALKAGRPTRVMPVIHLVGRRDGTPEEVERSTTVIRTRSGETLKLYTEDWGTGPSAEPADVTAARRHRAAEEAQAFDSTPSGDAALHRLKPDHTDRRYAIPVDVVEFEQPAITGRPDWVWWVKPDSRIGIGCWVESEGTGAQVINMTVGSGQNTKLVVAVDHDAESEGFGNPVAFRDSAVRAAVMELQKALGLIPDGIIGKGTMHRIQGIYPRRPA